MSFQQPFGTVIVSKHDTSHPNRPPAANPCGHTTPQAELLGLPLDHQPDHQQEEQPRPASAAPPPLPDSSLPKLPVAVLHGYAGLAVRTIAPQSEAHPASILLQLLAVFGNMVGRGPHCMVDATRHSLNLFLVLVGDSSKARKGTSWSQIARLFAEVDLGALTTHTEPTGGRPSTRWSAIQNDKHGKNEESVAAEEEQAEAQ
jgi:hypothetical protein